MIILYSIEHETESYYYTCCSIALTFCSWINRLCRKILSQLIILRRTTVNSLFLLIVSLSSVAMTSFLGKARHHSLEFPYQFQNGVTCWFPTMVALLHYIRDLSCRKKHDARFLVGGKATPEKTTLSDDVRCNSCSD